MLPNYTFMVMSTFIMWVAISLHGLEPCKCCVMCFSLSLCREFQLKIGLLFLLKIIGARPS